MSELRFKRAEKYGFCAGVRLADRMVKRFAKDGGRGGRILGQVVHNERVVREMEELGVPTIEEMQEAADGTIVFSAHGVPPSFHEVARRRGLRVLDTTCPFVYDIHEEADRAVADGYHLVFVGAPRHREVRGYTHDRDPATYHVLSTVEEVAAEDWSRHPRVKVLYQTTLNAEEYEPVVRELERRVDELSRADTVCYATKENQDAVQELARDPEVDLVLVIGGRHSANTRHLWEIARELKPAYLIHDPEDLPRDELLAARVVGITAGASTPESMIAEIEEAARRAATPAPAVG